MERRALYKNEQIVTARHEVTRLHLVEAREAFGEPVKPAAALRRDLYLNHRPHGGSRCRLVGKIEHRTPAEKDFILLQLLQVLFDFAHGQVRDLRDLRRREIAAFE